MKAVVKAIQGVLLATVLTVLVAHAVSSYLSHDENKFIYAGQALAENGWLPYRDYPYDQMPYTALFYAISAKVSSYEFLAARLMGALAWLACFIVLMAIVRLLGQTETQERGRTFEVAALAIQVVVLLVLLFHPQSDYVMSSAKNNSFATLFGLLAFLFFASAVKGTMRERSALLWSGACAIVAGCCRLNYLVLVLVLGILWLIYTVVEHKSWIRNLSLYIGGVALGGLPALALAATAPAQTYYANVVQLRLTTEYYRGILSRENMDLASKWSTFSQTFGAFPVNFVLYGVLVAVGAVCLYQLVRRRSAESLIGLGAAGFAGALLLTAFVATPMMDHYLFAPLPFLLVLAALASWMLMRRSAWALAGILGLLIVTLAMGSTVPGSVVAVSALSTPSSWLTVQFHEDAQKLSGEHHVPPGVILSLLPMFTEEAGYQAYPFTASGSNSWRTSLLLSAQRRGQYGVISPKELADELDQARPAAILTGVETPNPGFTFQDVGGLEVPFDEYARAHGYKAIPLHTAFFGRPLTLWIAPP